MPTAHLLNTLLPVTSVQLGRLVLNAKRPHQDFIDPLDGRPTEDERQQSFFEKFTETRKFSKISKLRLGLGDIAQFSFDNLSTSEATLSAPKTTTYELNNSGEWFESACKESRVQRWLEKAIDNNRTVYLIVGFRTVADASLTSKDTRKKNPGARTKVIMPSSVILDSATLLEPSGESAHSRVGGLGHAFLAPGDYAFAILYRKVKFSWLSSRKIDNMTLKEGNRWKSFWDWRGPDSEDDDEDDVVEANLTDCDLDISHDEYLSEDEDSYEEPSSITDTGNSNIKQDNSGTSCGGATGPPQPPPNLSGIEEAPDTTSETPDTSCKTDSQQISHVGDTESVDKASMGAEPSSERDYKQEGSAGEAGENPSISHGSGRCTTQDLLGMPVIWGLIISIPFLLYSLAVAMGFLSLPGSGKFFL